MKTRFRLLTVAALVMATSARADCPRPGEVAPPAELKEVENLQCAIRQDSGVWIDGTFPPTTYRISGTSCIDTRCQEMDPKIEETLTDVFEKTRGCFQDLMKKHGPPEALAAATKALADETLDNDETAALRSSAAARNTVLLHYLQNGDARFSALLHEQEQFWLTIDAKTLRERRSTRAEIPSVTPGPIRVSCFPLGTEFSYLKNIGHAIMSETEKPKATFGEAAKAALPGAPSWPSISLHPLGYSIQRSRSAESTRSVILHEMMHLLGYSHDDPESLPLYSACQICCFPKGLTSDYAQRKTCETTGSGSLLKQACELCAGATSPADFKDKRHRYRSNVKYCYTVGNPT